MENNIFENAKFGDKYITKDDRLALYLDNKITINNKERVQLYVNKQGTINYELSGKLYDFCQHPLDIVSKYQVPIDEDKLYKFSEDYFFSIIKNDKVYGDVCEAYKAGYRKANEE